MLLLPRQLLSGISCQPSVCLRDLVAFARTALCLPLRPCCIFYLVSSVCLRAFSIFCLPSRSYCFARQLLFAIQSLFVFARTALRLPSQFCCIFYSLLLCLQEFTASPVSLLSAFVLARQPPISISWVFFLIQSQMKNLVAMPTTLLWANNGLGPGAVLCLFNINVLIAMLGQQPTHLFINFGLSASASSYIYLPQQTSCLIQAS